MLPQIAAEVLIADKAYDADERVLKPLASAGKSAVIPPRQHRTAPRHVDEALYQTRHLIENFFLNSNKPRHRHALRQDRAKFPRRAPPRRRYDLA